MAGTGITLLHIFRGGLAGVWHRLLCILPFKGAAGGPDQAGSAAVQAQTAQKHSPAGWFWGRGLALAAGLIPPGCSFCGGLAAVLGVIFLSGRALMQGRTPSSAWGA